MHILYNLLEISSFLRGLTQEEITKVLVNINPVQYVLPITHGNEDPAETRKRKRVRVCPSVFHYYRCDPKIAADTPFF